MDVFELDDKLLGDYRRFARSFTQIRAKDTYCAAQSPHDQHYFEHPEEMVSGVVRPPSLDLANRDLISAHFHAVWLAESGQHLEPSIPEVLDNTPQDLSLPLLEIGR